MSHISSAPTNGLPVINIPHQSGIFVRSNEPALIHHSHPKPTVTLGFTLGIVHYEYNI